MKLYQRLEQQFIGEPTILFMSDGKTVSLAGPNDYLLRLLGLATDRERCTPQQAGHLDLIQCFQHSPAKESAEAAG